MVDSGVFSGACLSLMDMSDYAQLYSQWGWEALDVLDVYLPWCMTKKSIFGLQNKESSTVQNE